MKIAIIGAGGVGGYFGARLSAAGNDVRFLARGKHLDAIKKNGLFVKSINGDLHLQEVRVFDEIAALGKVDLVIVAVKSWQVKEVAEKINGLLNEKAMVLPLQNGILAAEELSLHIPQDKILKGLCRIFSLVDGPGKILHQGVDPTIIFGEGNNNKTARVEHLSSIFANAGIKHKIAEDIDAEIWKKFISICLSALMAVTKTTYGELRTIPETRKLMLELLNEVYTLALEAGVRIEADYIDKAVAFIETFKYQATASLTRDIWAGRPSEIEYQNGTVVRLAEEFGIHVPLNRFVYYSLLPGERKVRERGT